MFVRFYKRPPELCLSSQIGVRSYLSLPMYKGLIQKVGFFVKQILGSVEKGAKSVRKDVVFCSARRTFTFSPETICFRIPRHHNGATAERRGLFL